jgi:Cupin-like domain
MNSTIVYWVCSILSGAFAIAVVVLIRMTNDSGDLNGPSAPNVIFPFRDKWMIVAYWSLAQWIPRIIYNDTTRMTQKAWHYWENEHVRSRSNTSFLEDIPVVHVQDHAIEDLLPYIVSKYGKDWKKRPLLLKGLWKADELTTVSKNGFVKHRRLSLQGLLQENLTIPYFTDARNVGAITPDGIGTIQDIVTNITYRNAPHKIATQLLVQTFPELIQEVAPVEIVTSLFGSYFTPNAIRGSGPMQLFPAFTTVPLFIANSHPSSDLVETSAQSLSSTPPTTTSHTTLHSEPIGNVAVQLSGEKLWTLLQPEYSKYLRPYIAPDGRAFFASSLPISEIIQPTTNSVTTNGTDSHNRRRIPYYQAITQAGDALWVPTWTWHRVDYVVSSSSSSSASNSNSLVEQQQNYAAQPAQNRIAIGASLFHFRPMDFIQNNPLYALLIFPAILFELIGHNAQ